MNSIFNQSNLSLNALAVLEAIVEELPQETIESKASLCSHVEKQEAIYWMLDNNFSVPMCLYRNVENQKPDYKPVSTSEPQTPEVKSRWLNDRRQKVYTVYGVVSHCEDEADDWEVLYRSDDMPEGHFRRRSVESWYGTNRNGSHRFKQVG